MVNFLKPRLDKTRYFEIKDWLQFSRTTKNSLQKQGDKSAKQKHTHTHTRTRTRINKYKNEKR